MSNKIAKIVAFTLPVFIIIALTAWLSYAWGVYNTRELILHSSAPAKAYTPPPDDKSIETLRDQLDRVTNDYSAACSNYQTLYAAYDALYTKAGASSGQEKVVRPGSARGNDIPCYR